MKNGKNGSKLLPVIVIILAVIFVGCIGLLLWLENGGQLPEKKPEPVVTTSPRQDPQTTQGQENTTTLTTNTTDTTEASPTAPNAGDVVIETPYLDLYYPGEWSALLHTETEQNGGEFTVVFAARMDQRGIIELFRVTLNGDPAKAFANVKTRDGSVVPIRLQSADIVPDDSWTSSEIQVVFAMQEALNYVLEHLTLDYDQPQQGGSVDTQPPVTTEPPVTSQPPVQTGDDMIIDTLYAQLHFPTTWAKNLTLDIQEDTPANGITPYKVTFRCRVGDHDPVTLFVVHFGQSEGIPVTTVTTPEGKSVEVRLTICNIQLQGAWTQEESRTVYAMQEDLNYLIQKLTGG